MGALRLKLKPEPEYRTNRLPVLQVLVLLLEVPISLPAHALGLLAGKSSPIADVESISKSMRSGGGKPELPEAVRTKFRPMAQQAMRMLPPKPLPDGLAGGSKPPRRNIGRRIGTALAWIWLLALFVGVPVWVSSLPPQRTSAPVSPPAPSPTPKNGVWHKDYDPPEARPLPPPAAYPPPHGTIFRAPSDEQVAPFSVTTSAGASYLVKLVRTYDDRDALVVFIVGGQPFSTNVPVVVYALRYAAGPHEQWISEQHRFGYDTSYAKADRVLEFTIDGGKTVELILQRGGNLPTSRISRDQF